MPFSFVHIPLREIDHWQSHMDLVLPHFPRHMGLGLQHLHQAKCKVLNKRKEKSIVVQSALKAHVLHKQLIKSTCQCLWHSYSMVALRFLCDSPLQIEDFFMSIIPWDMAPSTTC
ncbi:hypothetical protein KP509_21G081500 [Ceratopteris richardii]|uniref:Uncharacterized protein n=1 Tax=Ceratopteris richardii TaxID=49495 RepID=A0A8T2SFL4_CERRI|nr:hypothetical protein KP509_21G081500 [Ceratopteris richardii]